MSQLKKIRLFVMLVCLGSSVPGLAQTADSISTSINKASRSLKDTSLSGEAKTTVKEQLDDARRALDESKDYDSQLKQYEQDVLQAKDKLASLSQQQQQLAAQVIAIPENATTDELANNLLVLNAEQNSQQSQLDELKIKPTRR